MTPIEQSLTYILQECKYMCVDQYGTYDNIKYADRVIADITGVSNMCTAVFSTRMQLKLINRLVNGPCGTRLTKFFNASLHESRCELVKLLAEAVNLRNENKKDVDVAYKFLRSLYKKSIKKMKILINGTKSSENVYSNVYTNLAKFSKNVHYLDDYIDYDDDEDDDMLPLFPAFGYGYTSPNASKIIKQYSEQYKNIGDLDLDDDDDDDEESWYPKIANELLKQKMMENAESEPSTNVQSFDDYMEQVALAYENEADDEPPVNNQIIIKDESTNDKVDTPIINDKKPPHPIQNNKPSSEAEVPLTKIVEQMNQRVVENEDEESESDGESSYLPPDNLSGGNVSSVNETNNQTKKFQLLDEIDDYEEDTDDSEQRKQFIDKFSNFLASDSPIVIGCEIPDNLKVHATSEPLVINSESAAAPITEDALDDTTRISYIKDYTSILEKLSGYNHQKMIDEIREKVKNIGEKYIGIYVSIRPCNIREYLLYFYVEIRIDGIDYSKLIESFINSNSFTRLIEPYVSRFAHALNLDRNLIYNKVVINDSSKTLESSLQILDSYRKISVADMRRREILSSALTIYLYQKRDVIGFGDLTVTYCFTPLKDDLDKNTNMILGIYHKLNKLSDEEMRKLRTVGKPVTEYIKSKNKISDQMTFLYMPNPSLVMSLYDQTIRRIDSIIDLKYFSDIANDNISNCKPYFDNPMNGEFKYDIICTENGITFQYDYEINASKEENYEIVDELVRSEIQSSALELESILQYISPFSKVIPKINIKIS